MRITIVLNYSLYISAEEPLGLTALVLIAVLRIVGSMPRTALSGKNGGNLKRKELELLLLSRFGTQLHGGISSLLMLFVFLNF